MIVVAKSTAVTTMTYSLCKVEKLSKIKDKITSKEQAEVKINSKISEWKIINWFAMGFIN
ncbi:hypothetical protein BFS30_24770 [Pedobacter steynii]|uniref:Uncharacterized protein n=1 Tax=Pedobacter steynii TaxID=430522 RepID=A0A1D7QN52_9SPHI|nr:hypothetical protein BFS30_24770 [Pedobacter steynii]